MLLPVAVCLLGSGFVHSMGYGNGGGDHQPMNGEMSPMNGEMPPMNGEMPPMNGEMPPMNGEMPPMNGEMPPMNGEMPPMNGEMPPMNGEMPPMNGEMPPMNGEMPPMNGEMPPMNGEMPPMNGEMPPMNGGPPPVNGMPEVPEGESGAAADSDERCCFWAGIEECEKNPFWMRPNCQKSCGTPGCSVENAHECGGEINLEGCPWQPPGAEGDKPDDLSMEPPEDLPPPCPPVQPPVLEPHCVLAEKMDENGCPIPTVACPPAPQPATGDNEQQPPPEEKPADTYETKPFPAPEEEPEGPPETGSGPGPGTGTGPGPGTGPGGCEDSDRLCNYWAHVGECEKNKKGMHKHCAKACGLC